MSKFLIENGYYIVPLDNCYALAKYKGTRERHGKESDDLDFLTFHSTVCGTLKSYIAIRQWKATAESRDGTIADMMRILSSENERLSERLKSLCKEIGE